MDIMETIHVKPISSKAKNRFANLMARDSVCIIEQIVNNKLFLRSANNRNFFWVALDNDPHWMIQ